MLFSIICPRRVHIAPAFNFPATKNDFYLRQRCRIYNIIKNNVCLLRITNFAPAAHEAESHILCFPLLFLIQTLNILQIIFILLWLLHCRCLSDPSRLSLFSLVSPSLTLARANTVNYDRARTNQQNTTAAWHFAQHSWIVNRIRREPHYIVIGEQRGNYDRAKGKFRSQSVIKIRRQKSLVTCHLSK